MTVGADQGAGTDDGTDIDDQNEDDLDIESLLGDGDESDEGDQDGEDEDGAAAPADVDAIVSAIEERLAARFDAVADRRVNALLKEIRKQAPAGGKESQDSGGQQPAASAGGDVRAARAAAREYLTDEVKFRGAEERAFAMDLVSTLVAGRAGDIEDEDVVGREIASEVASRVTALRQMYERQTVRALKKKGALVERPGQPTRQGGNGTSQTSELSKGAEIAARIRPVTQN